MNNCIGNFNEKLVIAASNYVRKLMNIDDSLWAFINKGDMFKSINHSGMFQKDVFVIRFNREWLETTTHERIIKCAFHETFHAVQYSAVVGSSLNLRNTLFTDEDVKRLTHEFGDGNYDDSNETEGSYLVEQQAEGFAIELYKRFICQYKNVNEFIAEYNDMYPNNE